jgi:hypothetical protein
MEEGPVWTFFHKYTSFCPRARLTELWCEHQGRGSSHSKLPGGKEVESQIIKEMAAGKSVPSPPGINTGGSHLMTAEKRRRW